ncbi:hypothetical protein HED63_18615 [Ochrobactrum cytisi]|nr:hypothetical protein [Brucella cytisi]
MLYHGRKAAGGGCIPTEGWKIGVSIQVFKGLPARALGACAAGWFRAQIGT